jgi:hypothetical protein
MKKQNKLSVLFLLGITIAVNAQISTGAGGAISILPNSSTTNTNVGIGTDTPIAKLEIAGFSGINKTYTFLDHADAYRQSTLLSIGSLRETAPVNAGGARLLTFYDVPASNIYSYSQTMLTIEDRNDANRLRHHAITNGTSSLKLSDKTQKTVFDFYEDGLYVFLTLPKPDSYFTLGGIQPWPNLYRFMVKNGASKFEGNVYVDSNIGIGILLMG